MLHSATCWLAEAQSWLGSTCTYTTAKNLQSHANTLQVRELETEPPLLETPTFPIQCVMTVYRIYGLTLYTLQGQKCVDT